MVNISTNSVYTVGDGDEIELTIAGGYNTSILIILSNTFLIGRDEDTDKFFIQNAEWGDSEMDGSTIMSQGEEKDFVNPSTGSGGFSITLSEDHFTSFVFTIDFLEENITGLDQYMSEYQRQEITSHLREKALQPVKYWKDFNSDHQEWLFLKKLSYSKLIYQQDVPNEPKIEEYTF